MRYYYYWLITVAIWLFLICSSVQVIHAQQSNGRAVLISAVSSDIWYITPDGNRVIYSVITSSMSGWRYSVYSIPIEGGTPVNLGELPPGYTFAYNTRSYNAHSVSNDSRYLIYVTKPVTSPSQLPTYILSAAIDNGQLITLTARGGNPVITPNSRQVLYYVYGEDLYSVPIEGGDPYRFGLNMMLLGAPVQITPDSQQVIFIGKENGLQEYHIYRLPLTGGTPVRLDPDNTENVGFVRLLNDANHIVYATTVLTNPLAMKTFFRMDLNSSTSTVLSQPFQYPQIVNEGYQLSLKHNYFLYGVRIIRQPVYYMYDGEIRLYNVPLSGGQPIQVHPDFPSYHSVQPYYPKVNQAETHVAYVKLSPNTIPNGYRYPLQEMYVSALDGSKTVKIDGPYRSVHEIQFAFAGDNKTLLYGTDMDNSMPVLFQASIFEGKPITIGMPIHRIDNFDFHLVDNQVIYGTYSPTYFTQLYSRTITSQSSIRLNGDGEKIEDVQTVKRSNGEICIVYVANYPGAFNGGLFSTCATTAAPTLTPIPTFTATATPTVRPTETPLLPTQTPTSVRTARTPIPIQTSTRTATPTQEATVSANNTSTPTPTPILAPTAIANNQQDSQYLPFVRK